MKRIVLASLALALPGCLLVTPPSGHMSGDGGMPGNDANIAPVSATAACGEIAMVACTGYFDCCPTHSGTMSDCISYLHSACAARLDAVFLDPRTGYSPTVAGEVLAEGRALVAGCDPGIIAWYNSRMGLQRAMQGTLPGGAMCATRGDDAPAYFSCNDFANGCIGDNASGYYCSARRETGLVCHTDVDCISADYCEGLRAGDNPVFGLAGHCQPRLRDGAACGTDGACLSYLCDTMGTHTCVGVDAMNAYCGLH